LRIGKTPKENIGDMSNLEPIPYNPHDVLDDDAFPIIQTWNNTNIFVNLVILSY